MTPIRDQVARFVNLNVPEREDYTLTQGAQPGPGQEDDLVQQQRVYYSNGRKILESELQGKTSDLLSPMTPFCVRQVIIASYNAEVDAKDRSDGDYIRMKNFWGGLSVGFGFTLLARIIRVVVRVAFIWLSTLVSAYQQATYGKKMGEGAYNIVFEDWKRIGYEIVDLFVTLGCPVIALVNFVAPRAISNSGLRNYYMSRIDQVRARNQIFNDAREAYNAEQAQKRAAFYANVPAQQ